MSFEAGRSVACLSAFFTLEVMSCRRYQLEDQEIRYETKGTKAYMTYWEDEQMSPLLQSETDYFF